MSGFPTSGSTDASGGDAARIHGLDALRGVLMVLGILLHVALNYIPSGASPTSRPGRCGPTAAARTAGWCCPPGSRSTARARTCGSSPEARSSSRPSPTTGRWRLEFFDQQIAHITAPVAWRTGPDSFVYVATLGDGQEGYPDPESATVSRLWRGLLAD